MATIDKNFKVKNGLVVEGTTATVNGDQVLTENASDQYIINLIGGTATPDNTPDTVVKRDENGDFAAGEITADLVGDVTGQVSDISNHTTADLTEDPNGPLYFTDSRVKDVLTGATKTNITIETIAGELHITAENGVADSTTDDLTEGASNKYFTDSRVQDVLSNSAGQGLDWNSDTNMFDINASGVMGDSSVSGLTVYPGTGPNAVSFVAIDRNTVDTWYDAEGAAQDVQDNLDTHTNATAVHGVTGDVVGTSDAQTLTNKTIGDILTFNDGSNNSTIDVDGNNLYVNANNDLTLSTANGNIVLNPDGHAYIGSSSAGNEIATNSYVDNAVSGLDWKQAVHLLYDAAIPVLSGSGATQLAVDGHDPLGDADSGYRLLLAAVGGSTTDGIYVYNSTGGSWTLTRATDADTFEELVGAAVFVMEGTQYGNTSWVQSSHYLTDFTGQSWTQFSGSGSVVAGTGITVDGLEVSVDRTTVDTWYDAAGDADQAVSDHNVASGVHGVLGSVVGTSDSQTLTNKTIDASSNTLSNIANSSLTHSSVTINSNSVSLGDSITLDTDDISEGVTNEYFTQSRARQSLSAGTAISYNNGTGEIAVDASQLDTDDISEGATNHYFTDGRAKTAAADLLTNASLTNITITGDGSGLTITAENGVADSDTDDLAEGSTNLYFTNQRALDAVANSTIYPNVVEINDYRKEEATQQSVQNASTVNVHSFSYPYESAKYLVRVVGWVGGVKHSQMTEILMTVDGNDNIAITEYGTICTDTNNLASSSATFDAGSNNYVLTATTAVAGCEIIAAATLLSWAD